MCQSILRENGFENIVTASTALNALERMSAKPDMAVLDVMLPDMDGFMLAKTIREQNPIPILFLTAKGEIDDKSKGFEVGADDYMVKPVDFEEMLLRVAALLRRAQAVAEHNLNFGNVDVDYDALTVTINGNATQIPKKEMQLLFKLLSAPNKTFTRRQLMDEIWGPDSDADERTVDVHIKRLREKFSEAESFSIVTVRGLGYRAERSL